MAFLVDSNTHYLIQGITGKEGQRALTWMLQAGSSVSAGVTPGKGGQTVEGVPVYNTVSEALYQHPEINFASIYVPPKFVLGAATESIEAKIPCIHIIAEGVPTKDTAIMIELARQANVKLIGPSSIGIASPGHSVVGSLSGSMIDPDQKQFLAPSDNGGVAIISKSGGMANTIANMLTNEGIAQTTIAGIGGDRLIGTSFADLLPLIEADGETKATVIIGEFGGSYEEDLAAAITALQQPCKPIIAFISGLFAQTLPQGVSFGHAGAIVSKTVGTREGKITALENAGVIIAQTPTDIPNLLKQSI